MVVACVRRTSWPIYGPRVAQRRRGVGRFVSFLTIGPLAHGIRSHYAWVGLTGLRWFGPTVPMSLEHLRDEKEMLKPSRSNQAQDSVSNDGTASD